MITLPAGSNWRKAFLYPTELQHALGENPERLLTKTKAYNKKDDSLADF